MARMVGRPTPRRLVTTRSRRPVPNEAETPAAPSASRTVVRLARTMVGTDITSGMSRPAPITIA